MPSSAMIFKIRTNVLSCAFKKENTEVFLALWNCIKIWGRLWLRKHSKLCAFWKLLFPVRSLRSPQIQRNSCLSSGLLLLVAEWGVQAGTTTPCTVSLQAPTLSMGFQARIQGLAKGLLFPLPGNLSVPGIGGLWIGEFAFITPDPPGEAQVKEKGLRENYNTRKLANGLLLISSHGRFSWWRSKIPKWRCRDWTGASCMLSTALYHWATPPLVTLLREGINKWERRP